MKTAFFKVIAVMCAVMLVLSLAACGNNSTPAETEAAAVENDAAAPADTEAAPADTEAAPADDAAADTGIEGSWEYESGGYIYTFNADGTGTYDISGTIMNFTYTAEGGVLAITYEGSDAPMELEYEIDGDKLNVKDSMGSDTIYYRK